MAVLPPILVILGPTASGKSALADELARQCGAEIVSVDSMQVYRGMDIGTAKPTAVERARVKHHLIDVADPNELFTVARFVELADAVIADAAGRPAKSTSNIGSTRTPSPGTPGEGGGEGDFERQCALDIRSRPHPTVPELQEDREREPENDQVKVTKPRVPLIATGGTPLYYKALFEGLFDGPQADESLRASLAQIPNEQLHERLSKIDPQAAARIHLNDSRRMIRAIEVFELTGQPISSFQTDWNSATHRHQATFIGLQWDKEPLNRRINARVKAMIAAGWVEETRALLDRYGQLSQTAAEATGYRELIDHIQGKLRLDDAIEQIKIATRQLARKQMKWFRRFANVKWIAGDVPVATNVETVLSELNANFERQS